MSAPLTWFGGYRGVVAWSALELHLQRDDGPTFCLLTGGFAPVTAAQARSPRLRWCEVCHRRAQEARPLASGAVPDAS